MSSINLNKAAAHDATLMFDIPVLPIVFDEWCRSLSYNPPSDLTGLDSFAPTDSEIFFEGELQVESVVRGNVRSAHGTLVMTSAGRIEADVDVRAAIIDGFVQGTLRATEYVILKSNARVSGNIHTASLTVKDGAVFDGSSYFIEHDIYSSMQTMESENEALQVSRVGA